MSKLRLQVLLICALFCIQAASFTGAWFAQLDAVSLDISQRWYAREWGKPHPDIVLIDIDDYSLNKMAAVVGAWPWPRSVYAYLLEGLQPFQPQAWIFDILLTEPDLDRPDDDAFWLETLQKQQNVFLSAVLLNQDQGTAQPANALPTELALRRGHDNPLVPALWPIGSKQIPAQVGLINASADVDGIYRRYPLTHQIGNWHFPSLPWRFSQGSKQATTVDLWLSFQSALVVPYASIHFADAFDMALTPKAEFAQFVAGKILIVGSSAVGLADLKHTAIAAQQPGMVLLATAIDNLLTNNAFQRRADYPLAVLLALQLLLLFGLYRRDSGFQRFLAFSLLLLSLLVICSGALLLILLKQNQLLAFGQLLAWLCINTGLFNTFAAIREYQSRQYTTRLFSRFVDPRVVQRLVGQQQLLAPQKCQITVLFTDIRGFTSMSEHLEAAQMLQLLNDYLALQVATLFSHQATLDKFIGDAIMAFWGAPLPQPQQADAALRAAQDLVVNMQNFCAQLPADVPHFDIGIGIHTGPAVVGLLGTEQKLDYTAIGDTVNVASRLESASKDYGRILCSADTVAQCQQQHPLLLIGEIDLKGRSNKIQIYRLGD